MRTRTLMSPEGTLELIDLTHASDREAMSAILEARRGGRPGRRAGPALMIDFGPLGGTRREPAAAACDEEPRAQPRARGGEHDGAARDGVTFSLPNLGDVLRQMAGAPGGEPGPDGAPEAAGTEERPQVEQILTRRTIVVEESGAGKMVAAAVVGFGLGVAAVFLSRRFRYVAPPSPRRERPRTGYRAADTEEDAAWRATLAELERLHCADSGDDPEGDEPPIEG
jgi:hypothetical protein